MARGDTTAYIVSGDTNTLYNKTFAKAFTTSGTVTVNCAVYINSGGLAVQCGTGTEDDCIGVAIETKTTGLTVGIAPIGTIVTTFTGQTPGTLAYIQTDGTITTTFTAYPIGRFISGTELLITKNAE